MSPLLLFPLPNLDLEKKKHTIILHPVDATLIKENLVFA